MADAVVVRRLALIRLLHSRAEEQASQSPPFSTDSINRLHDVAEMFLALAAEQHHAAIPRNFTDYWPTLEKVTGRPLAYRAQMQKLNKVRVNLKHYGIEPTTDQIAESVAAVRGLLVDECPALLGIDIEDVSLLDVVTLSAAKALLHHAEQRWDDGDATEAFADLADAFDILVRDYRGRKQVWHGRSVFDSAEDMTFLTSFHRRVSDREQARFEDAVIKSLERLDFKVMLVGIGIDMRRYGRFMALTPVITRTLDGTRHLSERPGVRRSDEDFRFCRDFVIATAIHLGEVDYEFDFWEAHQSEIRARDSKAE